MITRAFRGAGSLSIAQYASAALFDNRKFLEISNASEYNRSATEQTSKTQNFMNPAGGTWASQSRIESIEGGFTMWNWSPENLALVLWGNTNALAATAIVGEAHVINAGAFIPTKRIINMSVAPVVKKGATVVAATDYTVSTGGILIKDTIGTATVVSGDSITIDYTPQAGFDVQALISSAPLVSIFFNGTNAYDNKACTDRVWKARLGIAKEFALIGATDLAGIPLTFSIEQDETIVGAGLSQYFVHQGAS